MKKIKNSQPQTKFTGSYKKKTVTFAKENFQSDTYRFYQKLVLSNKRTRKI